MSKVNQIQQALFELDGGTFQKLADAYLVKKGFGTVNSIGSVSGANKVRTGTPDTLIALPSGRYLFAEHTTQQSGLLEKMRTDLGKCFDPDKVGIPVEKIEGVIFCFTGKLDTKEQEELTEICRKKKVKFDLFGIDALSFDLYTKYPHLAHDFLDVPIDTGQIVPPDQFVSLYNHNKLATRLDLGFHFREEELDRLLAALEGERLAILSGKAGVGKSRLALEACRRFREEHPEYEVLCVFGRNCDLWEDLRSEFSRPGRFLILVDDANRVSRFDYVVDLLLHQREEDQRIKVVATVRDYALSKVQEAARPLGGNGEIALSPLTDDQIKELLTDEYEIRNHHYLERIADIARGNPRLAVMAAEVAKEEESLNSIRDVSALYDRYFFSIREDLRKEGTDPESAVLLRAAAIVSFFRAVDRDNNEMMGIIEDTFGITPAMFWEAAERLHELEMLDMHENEVVKLSDQVLGTYLFYLAVFREKILGFDAFLEHLFPRFRQRLIDSINPVLDAFDTKYIIDAMRPHVARVWSKREKDGDENGLLHLIDDFWFTRRTETLLWARERTDELEAESVAISDISFEKSPNSPASPSILSILSGFAFAEESEARMALDLLLRYLAKRPSEVPLLLHVLIDGYGFRPESDLRGISIPCAVVDTLWNRAKDGNPLFSRVFLAIAGEYLKTHFKQIGMKGEHTVQITNFDLSATQELVSLREAIWNGIFALYGKETLREEVLALIRRYSAFGGFELTNSEVVGSDAEHVRPFLSTVLDPEDYRHCALMHDYLDLLEEHDAQVPANLRERFSFDTHTLADLLIPKLGDRKESELSYEEYEQYKRERLARHTANYTLDDYARFFDQCLEIRDARAGKRANEYQFPGNVESVLLALADRDFVLYEQVLALYLERQNPLGLYGYALVQRLLEQRGYDDARRFLGGPDYPARRRWLFHLHEALPDDAVNRERLGHLYGLYREAEPADLPYRIDYLLKYLPLDARIVAKVVAMVLEKAENEPNAIRSLMSLYYPDTAITNRLPELFANDIDLLKRAYLVMESARNHKNYSGMGTPDYNGAVFGRILDLDPAFITEFISWKHKNAKHGWLTDHDDERDYAFIWALPDYRDVMNRLIESIRKHEPDLRVLSYPYLGVFFGNRRGNKRAPGEEARKRQNAYLLNLIDERSGDMDLMMYLFEVISPFPPDRRRTFVERFVGRNQSFDAFKRLSLEPSSRTWSGSKVPLLQKDVDYWESLLPIMNTVDLLPHKQYVENCIQRLRDGIAREKKNDFMGD